MAIPLEMNKPLKSEAVVTISLKVSRWVHIRYQLAFWLLTLTGWLLNCDIEFIQEFTDG